MKKIKDFFIYILKKLKIIQLLIVLNPVVLANGYLVLRKKLEYSNVNIAVIYGELISDNLLLYILIPLFIVLNSDLTNYLNKTFVITRYVNISSWWKDKATITLILSLIYACVINIIPLLMIFFVKKTVLTYISNIILLLILQFIGFAVIGLTYNLCELILNKANISIVLNIILFGGLKVIKYILSVKSTFIYEYMIFKHKALSQAISINKSDYMYLTIALFVFIIIYSLGYFYCLRKDFYKGE